MRFTACSLARVRPFFLVLVDENPLDRLSQSLCSVLFRRLVSQSVSRHAVSSQTSSPSGSCSFFPRGPLPTVVLVFFSDATLLCNGPLISSFGYSPTLRGATHRAIEWRTRRARAATRETLQFRPSSFVSPGASSRCSLFFPPSVLSGPRRFGI